MRLNFFSKWLASTSILLSSIRLNLEVRQHLSLTDGLHNQNFLQEGFKTLTEYKASRYVVSSVGNEIEQ